MNEVNYTLDELAGAFDLTPRTARHYIEKVLPAHHKQGRGRRARYGQDTFNCFAFIRKARDEGLTANQISRVLDDLSQDQINRVAEGLQDLAIVSAPVGESPEFGSAPLASASSRLSGMIKDAAVSEGSGASVTRGAENFGVRRQPGPNFISEETEAPFYEAEMDDSRVAPRWQVLFSDEELQITHRGDPSVEQREQVRIAASLIKRILGRKS